MPSLELTDLASAFGLLEMQLDERANFETEEEYFAHFYNVDFDKLSEIFANIIGDDFCLENAFRAAYLFYELGRLQEKVESDTPVI